MGIFCSSEFAPEMYLNSLCATACRRQRTIGTVINSQLANQRTLKPVICAGSMIILEIFVYAHVLFSYSRSWYVSYSFTVLNSGHLSPLQNLHTVAEAMTLGVRQAHAAVYTEKHTRHSGIHTQRPPKGGLCQRLRSGRSFATRQARTYAQQHRQLPEAVPVRH